MTVLYLDPYFLGDSLFLGGFARDLAARPPGAPLVIVHGSGEAGERALEAQGLVAESVGGVWQAATPAARASVERAVRELNRTVVHELNESNVAAVRVMGLDRGLLRADGDGVSAGRTGWLETLARQNAVPVVAALVRDADGNAHESDPARAAAALAGALGADAVTALLKGRAPSVQDADGAVETLAVGEVASIRGLPDAEAVERIVQAGSSVRLTSLASIRAGDSAAGTLVSA